MKSFSKYMLLVALTVALVSCAKDSDVKVAAVGEISATIDGEEWHTRGRSTINNNSISISGNENDKTVLLTIYKSSTKGVYSVKGAPSGDAYDAEIILFMKGGMSYYTGYGDAGKTVGSIKITEIDETNKTISGTFSGRLRHSAPTTKDIEIKGGTFNKVPYDGAGPFHPKSFKAKADGVPLTASWIYGKHDAGKITVSFQLTDNDIISITFPDDLAAGKQMTMQGATPCYATYMIKSVRYLSTSGTLKITMHNTTTKRVEGTFNFKATASEGTIAITEGSFAVDY